MPSAAEIAAASYFATIADGVAGTAVGEVFTSDEHGALAWYRHTDSASNCVLIGLPGSAVITVATSGTRGEQGADYVCDGAADEAEINAAIAAANTAGGGEVIVAPGDYSVSSTIVMLDNVALTIVPGARIVAAADFTGAADASGIITAAGRTNFKVRGGGLIDGRTNNILVNGIECRPATLDGVEFAGAPCSYFEVDGMEVRCAKAHTYHIWSMRGQYGQITRNHIDGGYTSADTWDGTESQEGIECYGGVGMLVMGNKIDGVGGSALNFPALTDAVGETGLETICVAENESHVCGRFIQAHLTSSTTNGIGGMQRCIIRDNRATDVYVGGIDFQFVSTADDGEPIIFKNNVIGGNVIRMAAVGQVAASRAILFNNQRDPGGIDSSGNAIDDNHIVGCMNTDSGGQATFMKMSGFDLRRNKIVTAEPAAGNSNGFYAYQCSDFAVCDNEIAGAELYGLHFIDCVDGRVNRNKVREWNQALVGTAGIIFETGTTGCANIRVFENDFLTATLANVGSLVVLANECSRFDYWANTYVTEDFTGSRTTYNGSNPMNVGLQTDAGKFHTVAADAANTVTLDMNVGKNFTLTLTADTLLGNPIHARAGDSGYITVKQDTTGNHVLVYHSNWRFPGGQATGGAVSTAADSVDLIRYVVQPGQTILATLEKGFAR